MKKLTIKIKGDKVNFLDSPELSDLNKLGRSTIKRISRVEPINWFYRLLFYTIRFFFGDHGKGAAYTREWKCLWRVRMLHSGYIFGRFPNRQEAIDAEIQYWNSTESKLKGARNETC